MKNRFYRKNPEDRINSLTQEGHEKKHLKIRKVYIIVHYSV